MYHRGCKRRWKRILLASALFGMASSGVARAQVEPQADIMVTARKVSEPLLKAPVAVTSVSGDTIVAAGLERITDPTRIAPNVDLSCGIAGPLQGQIHLSRISKHVRKHNSTPVSVGMM